MKRLVATLAIAVMGTLCLSAPAQADFGLQQFDLRFTNENGGADIQAGSHPFAMELFTEFNYTEFEPGRYEVDGGDIKDLIVEQARGFVGNATAVPRCTTIDFVTLGPNHVPSCPDNTAVGVTAALLQNPFEALPAAVFNLTPPPGVAARLGFSVSEVPVVIDLGLKQSPDYNIVGGPVNAPQPLTVFGAALQIWGTPADPAHDFARGNCVLNALDNPVTENIIDGRLNLIDDGDPANDCSAEGAAEVPLLTLPRTCDGPLATKYKLDSWTEPGVWVEGFFLTGPFSGCAELEFSPEISSQATVDSVEAPSGLRFELDFENENDPGSEGILDPGREAGSDMKKIVVTLPDGMTVNPSIGEGLGVCTPADLDRETISAAPGEGCPNASKIGTVRVDTPLVDQPVEGAVFLAQQNDPDTAAKENPFDSLIAFYIVLKNTNLGVLVKVPAKVEPDPVTGQLVTTVDDTPQVPFSRFIFHFREGQRAPLVAPPACDTYTTKAELTPWARPNETVTETASFQITRGVNGGPCPPGGVPPFRPGFEAGSLNDNAASYTPFLMRLTRADGEQDMTKFSAVLPPGVLGKLAGVDECPVTQISLAKTKSGRAELRSPSCPTNSLIGHTIAGAGVGSALTYVPGFLYLAGPYNGAPLSVVSVTPAVAGPFDAGTVVVRIALDLDPKTGEVKADGAASDPIPHILKGIPLKVRDIRVDVDRPNFTLNPTSCDESQTKATLFGSYLNLFSAADDVPVNLSARFQAANCSRLGFKPKLSLRLKGGTRRGGHPALHAVLRARPGDANIEDTVVRLPRSAFLDQGHIRTICTRVQFAAKACPKGAIYGRVKAFTPLLDDPLVGPAYLRSSNNKLPDLVFDLHGIVDVEASARIDSIKGGIRATFTDVPDAPISKVIVDMQGGDKGLIVNSRNLCAHQSRTNVTLDAHNGVSRSLRPLLQPQCRKGRKAAARHR